MSPMKFVIKKNPLTFLTVSNVSVRCAAGGNLHDILREEEAKAAAARAAQPASTDVKTAAPGANRASGWARVAASPIASRGIYTSQLQFALLCFHFSI